MLPPVTGGSIAKLIVDAVARFPDRLAVKDDTHELTYSGLGLRIGQTIALYRQLGLAKGDGIAVLTSNRVDAWPAICAANVMGLRYTPLHPLSSEDDQAFVAADAQIGALIVCERKFAKRGRSLAERLGPEVCFLSLGPVEGATDLVEAARVLAPAPLTDETSPEDLVWLAYTGGTTGRSKGVMLSHRSVATMAAIIASEWEWPETIRYGVCTPVSHAAGILLYAVMLRGGSAYFLDGYDTQKFCQAVDSQRLTVCFLVPTIIAVLLDAEQIRSTHDLSSLKLLVYGSAPISPDRLRAAIGVFGPIFLQLYGQTEVPNVITTLRIADHDVDHPRRLGSCGRPSLLAEVKLLDSSMGEVAVGQPGEICVRGPLCCSGYWNQPELTEALFAGGWLHTGDVAIRDDEGFFYIVDRTKDLIITGGFNVYPREVEDALMSHPDVLQAAVIGIPDAKWGEAVTAFVQLRKNASVTTAELQTRVRERRGGPWTPKSITVTDAIPLTGLGKVDRKALRAPFWGDRARSVS